MIRKTKSRDAHPHWRLRCQSQMCCWMLFVHRLRRLRHRQKLQCMVKIWWQGAEWETNWCWKDWIRMPFSSGTPSLKSIGWFWYLYSCHLCNDSLEAPDAVARLASYIKFSLGPFQTEHIYDTSYYPEVLENEQESESISDEIRNKD